MDRHSMREGQGKQPGLQGKLKRVNTSQMAFILIGKC